MELGLEITAMLKEMGAALVGFGDLSGIPQESRQGYKTGVSIAVALDPEVIKNIDQGPTLQYYEEYKRVNGLLDKLAAETAAFLEKSGYKAYAMTNDNVMIDEETRRTSLPHKTVATRSGLGWIGKCALLVTREYGSAIRVSSVLTDADLVFGIPTDESDCGGCNACELACPGKAVSGRKWSRDIDRDEFFNAFDCRKTARDRAGKAGIDASICGLCILVCPWTQRYLKGDKQ